MDLQLAGQVAVVVGAASGLGRAIASAFAAEQATVALLDISPDVRDVGPAAWVVVATDYAAVRAAAADVRQRLGRVDHVVFAAGIGSCNFGFPFWHLDPSCWPWSRAGYRVW